MGTRTTSKGNARERRKAARAEQFGPPGTPQARQREVEATFGRMYDSERGTKADTRELRRDDAEPRDEGLIQKAEVEEIGGAGRRVTSKSD